MAIDLKYGKIDIKGVPDDEPVFILRAQDQTAADTIIFYACLAVYYESEESFVSGVRDVVTAFGEWQKDHAEDVKLPD